MSTRSSSPGFDPVRIAQRTLQALAGALGAVVALLHDSLATTPLVTLLLFAGVGAVMLAIVHLAGSPAQRALGLLGGAAGVALLPLQLTATSGAIGPVAWLLAAAAAGCALFRRRAGGPSRE